MDVAYAYLSIAIVNGNLGQVRELVKSNAELKRICGNDNGFFPLASAIHGGNFSIIKYSIEKQIIHVNETSGEGIFIFLGACLNRRWKIARYLITHANMTVPVLGHAVQYKQIPISLVYFLIQRGESLFETDKDGLRASDHAKPRVKKILRRMESMTMLLYAHKHHIGNISMLPIELLMRLNSYLL